ncbi:PREDICTED: uncharacterized protein LOC104827473 [Tarenaya hassleriana]|uniref:uncharacterized protein LOC104827473 n=1 Tax=Tarenaya hassleriana TaxID=28532 RepID=UPI00053C08A0|nr:PREDICTED: uncharacterized protein LOC104827473 [Tarenaya hassleriana]
MGRPRILLPVLEINMISAQDLASVSRNMKTYAVAWINTDPMRKLTTRVDQTNRANPIWNEKLVFRVNDKILNVDASAIVIEIYAAAWAKDALVGSINVLLSDLFAPWSGFNHGGGNGNNNMRLVTLQIRRPSGRLQGLLRLGIALLDGTQRSMPLSVEVFDGSNHGGHRYKKGIHDMNGGGGGSGGMVLRRTHSDQTDLTTSTDDIYGVKPGVVSGGGGYGGTDSMVNGSDLCCSDIGPSASVVAAAIAQGLYNRQKPPEVSSIVEGTTEGVKRRLERWRSETTPSYVEKRYKNADSSISAEETTDTSESSGKGGTRKRWRRRRDDGDAGKRRKKGLFSCFGNVFGCEISITCGGCDGGGSSKKKKKKTKKKKKRYSKNKVANLSSVDETFSRSAA